MLTFDNPCLIYFIAACIEPDSFYILEDRLFLFWNPQVLVKWLEAPYKYIAEGDVSWVKSYGAPRNGPVNNGKLPPSILVKKLFSSDSETLGVYCNETSIQSHC